MYGRGIFGIGSRGGRGSRGGHAGGHGGRGNHNSYNNNGRQNHNSGVDASDLAINFTPEEASVLIQANTWVNICDEIRTKQRRLNNNDDGDITARVNYLYSNIENLQDTVSQITDNQTDNGGGNNNSGDNKNGGNNAHNGNGNGNNIPNSGTFIDNEIRRGEFYYMTTFRLATTNVHAMNHVPNPTNF